MRGLLLTVSLLWLCLAWPAGGRATISNNGYDGLVVAISPDVSCLSLVSVVCSIKVIYVNLR